MKSLDKTGIASLTAVTVAPLTTLHPSTVVIAMPFILHSQISKGGETLLKKSKDKNRHGANYLHTRYPRDYNQTPHLANSLARLSNSLVTQVRCTLREDS